MNDFKSMKCGPWAHKTFTHVMRHQRYRLGGGTLQCLILMTLRERPLHGYGIMSAIEAKRGYAPSPGAVYPTLQLLQDRGLISMTEDGDKKVYALTEEGTQYLEAHRAHVERINERLEQPSWNFIPGIGKRMGALAGTIISNYSCLDENKITRIEKELDETRQRIGDIVFEQRSE